VSNKRKVPIITLEPVEQPQFAPPEGEDAFSPQAKYLPKIWPFSRKQEVDYDRLKEDLEKVQGEMGDILASLDERPGDSSFSLREVSVALAVSGEGSIGVASVGVEASITLTFSHPG
jgi:hypothetical protein